MRRRVAVVSTVLSVLACGGSVSNPSAQTDGGPGGLPTGTSATASMSCPVLSGAQAVALKGVYDSSYPGLVTVVIVNHALSCSMSSVIFGPGDIFQNMVVVSFTLGATDASTVVTPGTYTAGSLTGGCEAYDAQCKQLPGGSENTGGTVTLTSAGPTTYAGTFTFECTCGTYTGSFEAPLCATPDAGSAGDAGMACLP